MATGYNTRADVLVNKTSDGIDLNEIWEEIGQALAIFNEHRTAMASLLSYATTDTGSAIPQTVDTDSFEEADEFGIPEAMRPPGDVLILGNTFKDWDLRTAFTWRYLRAATKEAVTANVTRALEADNRLINGHILYRLFNPAPGINEFGHTVYGLWNGTDGLTPPPFMGNEFSPSTTHYLASQASVIDSGDLEEAIKSITLKGYGISSSSQLLIFANPAQGEAIATFRAGQESRPGGPIAKHDFIRSSNAPAYLTQDTIIGRTPPGEYAGLPVSGSYGPAWLIESPYIPVGYVAVVASGGPNSNANPIAFREHPDPTYRGLLHIPGARPNYPLQDSYFVRSFGVGTRHRGAAAVIQVTTNPTYTAPAKTAFGLTNW
ncbi:hypothetical protein [Mycobacteroides saopaulense]|uniref:Bacteriophage protein n=1 Tax=Mycobacteroides saopaulense TaxID=1578165 RepID=A0ABX3C310_9MYCO|nr:hypothetical protein [Mycobacteroides saopaulense]OHT85278.1 hypothetical protein BKG68_15890 [Mycobacteroides saopaulense]OHU11429.1 hypothetical protein BKG73_08930 [Mycobacteroides saopaulense]